MRMKYLLGIVGVLGGAAVLGFVLPREGRPAPDPDAGEVRHPPAPATDGAPQSVIRGEVLETIDVPGYTYIRVAHGGPEGTWTAVTAPAGVTEGQQVAVVAETRMVDFPSKALGRTFDSIYFGALEGAPAPDPGTASPHAEAPGAPAAPDVGDVPPAEGDDGVRIADLHARKGDLAGRTVRVRGVVVKRVPGVMGRTFVHLQDGSGAPATDDHDLTVTMAETPEVGDALLVEGVVTVDKDFGAGYRYDVIIEDARLVTR